MKNIHLYIKKDLRNDMKEIRDSLEQDLILDMILFVLAVTGWEADVPGINKNEKFCRCWKTSPFMDVLEDKKYLHRAFENESALMSNKGIEKAIEIYKKHFINFNGINNQNKEE